jgi:DNA-directed RNA polymerase specialized sigma24 family protein
MEVARLVAMGIAKRYGLYGHALDDLLGDAYLATVILCSEWNPEKNIPRSVWVGKYCARRTIDLHRQRYGRGPGLIEVPFDDGWDAPDVGAEPSEFAVVMARIPEGRERYVVCRLLEGAYHREIAAELGISGTRVRQLLERVREWCEVEF